MRAGNLPLIPHSLAVGEDNALALGFRPESANKKELFLIRIKGTTEAIDYPDGYDPNSPDFEYPHVNYLGDGLFEVLQGTPRGNTTQLKSFEVRIPPQSNELIVERGEGIFYDA